MVSSISANSLTCKPCYSTTAIAENRPIESGFNSFAPTEHKTVTVDGNTYEVKEVSANDNILSIMPRKKEVVVIDGKEYDVKTVRDPRTCDGTKQVIIVDGQAYDVENGPSLKSMLGGILA